MGNYISNKNQRVDNIEKRIKDLDDIEERLNNIEKRIKDLDDIE